MKTSEKVARWSVALAALPIVWLWSHWGWDLPWWLYAICWAFLIGTINMSISAAVIVNKAVDRRD